MKEFKECTVYNMEWMGSCLIFFNVLFLFVDLMITLNHYMMSTSYVKLSVNKFSLNACI